MKKITVTGMLILSSVAFSEEGTKNLQLPDLLRLNRLQQGHLSSSDCSPGQQTIIDLFGPSSPCICTTNLHLIVLSEKNKTYNPPIPDKDIDNDKIKNLLLASSLHKPTKYCFITLNAEFQKYLQIDPSNYTIYTNKNNPTPIYCYTVPQLEACYTIKSTEVINCPRSYCPQQK